MVGYSEDEEGKEVQTAVTHSDITALKEELRQLKVMKDVVDKEVGCLQEEEQLLPSPAMQSQWPLNDLATPFCNYPQCKGFLAHLH